MAPVVRRCVPVGEPRKALGPHDRLDRGVVVSHGSRADLLVVRHRHPLQHGLPQALRVEGAPAAVHEGRDAKPAPRAASPGSAWTWQRSKARGGPPALPGAACKMKKERPRTLSSRALWRADPASGTRGVQKGGLLEQRHRSGLEPDSVQCRRQGGGGPHLVSAVVFLCS